MMSRILGVSRARRPGNYNAYEWTNSDGVVKAAIELAKKIQAKAIVTLTETGNTTRRVASYRMDIPHIALTPHISTIHRLQLSYGVTPHLITSFKTLDNAIASAKEVSAKLCSLKKGDSVVLVGGMPFGKAGGTNFVYTITL
jgi:pyruvate kinase